MIRLSSFPGISAILWPILLLVCDAIADPHRFLIYIENEDFLQMHSPPGPIDELLVTSNKESNFIAFQYDSVRNCFFQSNRTHIYRECIGTEETDEILTFYAIRDVENLAHDWLSQLLYFYDSHGRIQALQTKTSGESFLRRTIVNVGANKKVHGLVVHPWLGYLFWTQYDPDGFAYESSLYRSLLDGSQVTLLANRSVIGEPDYLTIDYTMNRLYFIGNGRVASLDVHGNDFREDYEFERYSGAQYQISADNNFVYWTDPPRKAKQQNQKLIQLNLKTNETLEIASSKYGYPDFHVYGEESHIGLNACSNGTDECMFCVSMPYGEHRCLCPDGMFMTYDGTCSCLGSADPERCFQKSISCNDNGFKCHIDGSCIAE